MSELVFAYGSNMCSGRFRDYKVRPGRPGVPALLARHKLRFNKLSQDDGSGKANVEPSPADETWGVVYSISSTDLTLLTEGEKGYSPQTLPVTMADGAQVDAWVYRATNPVTDRLLQPFTWYKRFLVEGAIEHGLNTEYRRALEAVDAVVDPDTDRDRSKRLLKCGEGPQ